MSGRNDPCPCGSGKKYKRCCGAVASPAAPTPAPDARIRRAADLLQQRATEAARGLCREIIADPGSSPESLDGLGRIAAEAGDLGLAEALFRAACTRQPGNAGLVANLAQALTLLGRLDEAHARFAEAVRLAPQDPGAHNGLGNVLAKAKRTGEAIEAYREALRLDPAFVHAWSNLADALSAEDRREEAEAAYRGGLAVSPGHLMMWCGLGRLYKRSHRLDKAVSCLRRAIAIAPGHAGAHNDLGNLLKDQGRLPEALAAYDTCLALEPNDLIAHSNRLLCLNYMFNESPAALFAAHRDWERRQAARFVDAPPAHGNDPDPERPLRVGFVSADLREHAVAQFLLPVLAAHDRAAIQVTCYSCDPRFDAMSEQLRTAADDWVDASAMGGDTLAGRIRNDRIDILVDLAGHTAGHRLLVFARKPAPVQASWLGYLNTTGLRAMDYRILDAITCPPGAEIWSTERPARLPHAPWCYTPPELAPAVSPLPALAHGRLCIASINAFQKLNDQVLDLWARLLVALPDSRLLALGVPEAEQARLRRRLAEGGVTEDRVELVARLPRAEYYAAIGRADLALDPFPFGGATTTCDALWMGVPVITLPGPQEASRSCASILSTIGLDGPEGFVARDADHYIAIARRVAADPAALASLRASLRQRMRATPLADAAAFTRNLEALFREMWRGWCSRRARLCIEQRQ